MAWKIKVITELGVNILGSYSSKKTAEAEAEKARKIPCVVKAEVFDTRWKNDKRRVR